MTSSDPRPEDRRDETTRPHEVPGSSGPGEPGYDGDVTVGEEATQHSDDPFGRPDGSGAAARAEVRHNTQASRYELLADGEVVGVADYRERDGAVVFHHTEIQGDHRGRGLGAVLVAGALDDVAEQGRPVVATCWFVAEFIDEHPEYQHLAA